MWKWGMAFHHNPSLACIRTQDLCTATRPRPQPHRVCPVRRSGCVSAPRQPSRLHSDLPGNAIGNLRALCPLHWHIHRTGEIIDMHLMPGCYGGSRPAVLFLAASIVQSPGGHGRVAAGARDHRHRSRQCRPPTSLAALHPHTQPSSRSTAVSVHPRPSLRLARQTLPCVTT